MYLIYVILRTQNILKKRRGRLQININKNDILSANIILKPIVEQKQIVAKLDAAFWN